MSRREPSRLLHALVGLALLSSATPAAARRAGIVIDGCGACHLVSGAELEISALPADFGPNADVTFTVTVRRPAGAANVGGVYVADPEIGELIALDGEGLTLASGFGLTHEQPKPATAGVVTFRFGWRAPPTRGGIQLDVFGISANGDNGSTGDMAGSARFRAAFGCTGAEVYADLDRDGFGNAAYGTGFACAGATPPLGYAAALGDCAENDDDIHPFAIERCNLEDDDCDGVVDEDAVPVELWPDEDGDGYSASQSGAPVLGCLGLPGYAIESGDCAPEDPSIFPGAAEVCNLRDDDCDGDEDEGTRPRCGVGACATESASCADRDCAPGRPSAEACNLSDDDCDGETDEGELCAAGESCLGGICVASGAGPAGSAGSSSNGGASSNGGSDSGANGSSDAGRNGGVGSASAGSRAVADPKPSDGCALRSGPGGARPPPSSVLALAFALLCARRRASRRASA